MKLYRYYLLVAAAILLCGLSSAAVINVPADQTTIQAGINISANGDTVLVQPNTYNENINFSGRNIVLGSMFLTTGDNSYISSTIIDGGGTGSVVTFANYETPSAQLTGFTITNGSNMYGGGIHCDGASPTINCNLITANTTAISGVGAGIACRNMANPLISLNTICGNSSLSANGGGIYCWNNSMPIIDRNTITGNQANYGGGIFSNGAGPIVTNTIFWNNNANVGGDEIYLTGSGSPTFNFCDIEGGWSGAGNIDCDPLFCNAPADNYYLNTSSCCIGNGEGGVNIGAFGRGCGVPITINVPGDYNSIQEAIDASIDGDTVLAAANTYFGTIDFSGKNIVVGSHFLTTGLQSDISNTIIDGNGGPGVIIASGEDSTAALIGFTIGWNNTTGIYCSNYSSPLISNNVITEIEILSGNGGGIWCNYNSSPTISNTVIINNYAGDYGGGICCTNSSHPTIIDCRISGNYARAGGGIYVDGESIIISNCAIFENEANLGAGIYCNQAPSLSIISSTIVSNSASTGDGLYCEDSNPVITNSIFALSYDEIYSSGACSFDITYSDIQDSLWPGEGNISCDPQFCDAGSNNYYLPDTSCCVGAGEGGVDIGAYGIGCRPPTTLNVPADYTSIQEAIDASFDGDTIIVQPNTYYENINYYGKSIILGSLFFTTGDTSYISSTIIDGGYLGTVVTFGLHAESTTVLTGFTIQNGYNDYGGGIYCELSNPTISFNSIIGNSSIYGGGISFFYGSGLIEHNTIANNNADYGGGIYCFGNSVIPEISYSLITDNTSTEFGGGIVCETYSNPIITNTTITQNHAGTYGGAIYKDSLAWGLTVTNSILWNNSAATSHPEIYEDDGIADIFYSDIQDTLWPGDGNINCDPLFCNPDSGNYYLLSASCCLGAGQDDTDIGAYGQGCIYQPITRNVPAEYGTIQAAINASYSGDTVLAQPDTYVENIDFIGKNIIVGSLFLTSGDTSYISSTIIDGAAAGSVVAFENGEDSTAMLTGFTIQNGLSIYGGGILCTGSNPSINNNYIRDNSCSIYGGGIYCSDASPSIINCKIFGNAASANGGGIYCGGYISPIISNCEIYSNSAENSGGGLYIYESSPVLTYNIFHNNNSSNNGGGICFGNAHIYEDILNNTITENTATGSGGGVCLLGPGTIASFTNAIFWGNTAGSGFNQFNIDANLPSITFSDIQDTVWPGEGNLSCDPMFCDSENGVFSLADTSCCVSAGEGGVNIGAYGIGCPAGYYTPIFDIQINNTNIGIDGCYPSPLAGETVLTGGIVTNWRKEADDNRLGIFFIQDPIDSVWGGLFVYDISYALDPVVAIGDSVSVQGEVFELSGLTTITNITAVDILSSGHSRPTPMDITIAEFLAGCDSTLEKYESVLARLFDVEVLSSNGNNWWITDPSTPDSIELSSVLFRADIDCVASPPSTGVVYNSVTGNLIWDGADMTWNIMPGCNDFDSGSGYEYLIGDANMHNGSWPPAVIGSDVTYLVNYFRGVTTNPSCSLDGFYAAADVNGSCTVIGSDVTRLVNFFRGQGAIESCPDYPPLWLTPADCPVAAPPGWPNCE